MAGQIDVVVSVISMDNHALLSSCLRTIAGACEPFSWQAVVVANQPGDGTPELLARDFPSVELITNQAVLGFGANHNQVIHAELASRRARFVLALNDDTELEPGSVGALIKLADAQPRAGVVGPTILDADGVAHPPYRQYPRVSRALATSFGRATGSAAQSGWIDGSCMLFRLDALSDVGAFDEQLFMFYEDVDICRRLADAGWGVVFASAARIRHYGHATVSDPSRSLEMERQSLRSYYLYIQKHHGNTAARLALAAYRGGLRLRLAKAAIEARVLRRELPSHAPVLRHLLSYDPNEALAHEIRATDGQIR